MTTDTLAVPTVSETRYGLLNNEAPTRWMMAAWNDFMAAPLLSLTWGVIFAGLGIGLSLGLNLVGLDSLIPAAMAGFFLVAPVLTVGMMELARLRSVGEPMTFAGSLRAWKRNPAGLGGIGMVLMLAMTAWLQIALLVFSLFFHANPPALDNFLLSLLSSDQAFAFLLMGCSLGGVLAATVFALGALSVPMLMERNVSVVEAMTTSAGFVWANRRVMLAWAACIVVLVGFGFLTFFLGLVLTLPLLAYGSWHLYEDFKSLSE